MSVQSSHTVVASTGPLAPKTGHDHAAHLDVAGVATALIDVGPAETATSTGRPPVLLLHGSGPGVTAAANWRPVIPALSADRRVLAPDQLGFGGTATGEPRTYGRTAWTEHALALLDTLGLETVDIIGNSMGGAIALSMAAGSSPMSWSRCGTRPASARRSAIPGRQCSRNPGSAGPMTWPCPVLSSRRSASPRCSCTAAMTASCRGGSHLPS